MNPAIIVSVVGGAAAGLAAAVMAIRQCRKPTGWLGQLFAHTMNASHRRLTRWGLSHVPLAPTSAILDVGCGGGKTIQELARAIPGGTVTGLDYSAASVAVAQRTNARAIVEGQVSIRQGSVSHLPFAAGSFDVVTAIETHYYWPDFAADLGEIYRVLRPGGRLILIAESYRTARHTTADAMAMRLLSAAVLSVAEHETALRGAGFDMLAVVEEPRKGWLCISGVKPTDGAG